MVHLSMHANGLCGLMYFQHHVINLLKRYFRKITDLNLIQLLADKATFAC